MRGFPVILALANQMKSPLGEGKQIVIMGIAAARLHKVYRIRSIRCRGYYLFHHAILCGFYFRAATIRERHILNSVVSVKSFVNVRALRKASFIRSTKN